MIEATPAIAGHLWADAVFVLGNHPDVDPPAPDRPAAPWEARVNERVPA